MQDYYFIIRDTDPLESLLLEYGFIDNPNDQVRLQNDLLNYVEAVVRAVTTYGGYTYLPPTGSQGEYYTVQSGDSLWSIARKFGVTVQELKDTNNLSSDTLRIGQVLKIPREVETPSEGQTYTVKRGDSLWSIARDFGITVQALRNANNLTSDTLQIGQVLTIPGMIPETGELDTYIVKRGDSLWSIASAFNTSVNELRRLNNLTTDVLQIGQVLQVPRQESITPPTVTPPTNSTYTVQSGDSLWSIAREFGISVDALKEANNLTSNLLSIGQVLQIPGKNTTNTVFYTVKRGDSLWSIARDFGVSVSSIQEANNLTSSLLQIGEVLQIPV